MTGIGAAEGRSNRPRQQAVEVDMKLLEHIARAYCRKFHGAPYLPVRERYVCPKCLRQYRVDWTVEKPVRLEAIEPLTGIQKQWEVETGR